MRRSSTAMMGGLLRKREVFFCGVTSVQRRSRADESLKEATPQPSPCLVASCLSSKQPKKGRKDPHTNRKTTVSSSSSSSASSFYLRSTTVQRPSNQFCPRHRDGHGRGLGSAGPLLPLLGGVGGIPLLRSQKATFFVRSRETPNVDCLMFYSKGYEFIKSDNTNKNNSFPSPSSSPSCENQAESLMSTPSSSYPSSTSSIAMSFFKNDRHLSPLAEKIFEVNGIIEVTVGSTFVTVRRHNEALDGALEDEEDEEGAEDDDIDNLQGVKKYNSVAETDFASFAAKQHEWKSRMMNQASRPAQPPTPTPTPTPTKAATEAEQQKDDDDSVGSTCTLKTQSNDGGNTTVTNLAETKIEQLPHGVTAKTIEFDPELLNPPMDWHELRLPVMAAITDHVTSGLPAINLDAPHPNPDTIPDENDSEVVLMIKEHLSVNVRPVLHADGGDLRYAGYDDDTGVLSLELLGACRRCGSSKTTLHDLIERTTRHWIPEVKEVVEITSHLDNNKKNQPNQKNTDTDQKNNDQSSSRKEESQKSATVTPS